MSTYSILGCGWLGLPLAKQLVAHGHQVHGTTTNPAKLALLADAGILPYEVRLNALASAAPVLTDFFEAHAIIITVPPSGSKTTTGNNYIQYLSEFATLAAQRGQQRIVFISTTSVYPNVGRTVTEADAEYIRSPHSGLVMLEAEDVFRLHPQIEATVIRFGGLVGGNRHPGRFMAGKKGVPGGQIPVNLIHRDDCLEVIQLILAKNIWGQTLNACAGQHPDKATFYSKATLNLGLEPPQFSSKPSPFKIIDSGKLVNDYKYTFKYDDPYAMLAADW